MKFDQKISIRLLVDADSILFAEHLARNLVTSGLGDTPIFSISSRHTPVDLQKRAADSSASWNLPVGTKGWNRTWGILGNLETGVSAVVGACSLSSAYYADSQLHRAMLAMGIEPQFRSSGLGKKLIDQAINWALEQKTLSWIDLGVFAHNAPARRLYESFQFLETGRKTDLFRVDDQKLDDIQMSLELRQYKRPEL